MRWEQQIYSYTWFRKVGSVECVDVKNEVSMRLLVLLIRPPLIQPYRRYLNRVLYASHRPRQLIALIIWNCLGYSLNHRKMLSLNEFGVLSSPLIMTL